MNSIQNNQNAFYVTTPIFYPTGMPHIGTAYNMFVADALARYNRQQGKDTFFLTGTDEHGANIAKKASESGQSPQEYVNEYAVKFQQIWKKLGLTHDYFVRTTNPHHEKFTQQLIQSSYDNGDIYEGIYEGRYCQSCEAFFAEDDLVDGKCPNHPTKEPIYTKEKNYYFRWSKYQEWLLQLYENQPSFVRPQKWLDYSRDFVKRGLQDIPVTRANVSWGITVPFDPKQTIYVWYDALPNYLSTLHFPQFAKQNYVEKYWPQATHVVGKDIIKFHAILWPAMLKSAGWDLPKHIVTHGFFTVNGMKIGKSNNNAIDPVELTEKYGIDAVRYCLLSEFQLGNDGDFSYHRLEAKYNSDLANNWGNLLNRVIHLSQKIGVGFVKGSDGGDKKFTQIDAAVQSEINRAEKAYHEHMNNFELFQAVKLPNKLADFGNKYIDEQKPWDKSTSRDNAAKIMYSLQKLLYKIGELYMPFMPDAAQNSINALDKQEKVILFNKLENSQN